MFIFQKVQKGIVVSVRCIWCLFNQYSFWVLQSPFSWGEWLWKNCNMRSPLDPEIQTLWSATEKYQFERNAVKIGKLTVNCANSVVVISRGSCWVFALKAPSSVFYSTLSRATSWHMEECPPKSRALSGITVTATECLEKEDVSRLVNTFKFVYRGQSVFASNVSTARMVWCHHTPAIWWFVKRLLSDTYLEFAFLVHEQVASP